MTVRSSSLKIAFVAPDVWWRQLGRICAPGRQTTSSDWQPGEQRAEKTVWLSASRGGRVVALCRGDWVCGATATVTCPVLAEGEHAASGEAILRAADQYLLAQGPRLLCALVTDVPSPDSAMLIRAGYRPLGAALHVGGATLARGQPLPSHVSFQPLDDSPACYARLAEIFKHTCRQSKDFPELSQWLTIEQTLSGYRGVGRYHPEMWSIIRRNGRDAGCLLLNETHLASPMQLTYVGLAPCERGRGIGRVAVERARRLAHQRGASSLFLWVDARNQPALASYRAAGLEVLDRQLLMVKTAALEEGELSAT